MAFVILWGMYYLAETAALFVIFCLITREKLYRVVRRKGEECMF